MEAACAGFRKGDDWLYLAAGLERFSRRVVGRSMSAQINTQFAVDAPTMAVWRRGEPEALLGQTDKSSQFINGAFTPLLAEQNMTCRMSHRDDCRDNAASESFYSTL